MRKNNEIDQENYYKEAFRVFFKDEDGSRWRWMVHTRSDVSQGFCQRQKLHLLHLSTYQLKTKSNPGKYWRKLNFTELTLKTATFHFSDVFFSRSRAPWPFQMALEAMQDDFSGVEFNEEQFLFYGPCRKIAWIKSKSMISDSNSRTLVY